MVINAQKQLQASLAGSQCHTLETPSPGAALYSMSSTNLSKAICLSIGMPSPFFILQDVCSSAAPLKTTDSKTPIYPPLPVTLSNDPIIHKF